MSKLYKTITTKAGVKVLLISKVPEDKKGCSVVDLYVRLPTLDHFICWLQRGQEFTSEMRFKLRNHADPRIYCPVDQWKNRFKYIQLSSNEELFGEDTKEIVTDLYIDLLDQDSDSQDTLSKLIDVSSEITESICKDLKGFEKNILSELKDIKKMEMSYAIRSLSVLFCMSNDIRSKKSLYDITTATLFMDVALFDFTDSELNQVFLKKAKSDLMKQYKLHPSKAHLMAQEKVKDISQTGLQIILNHHEYHNGHGFPRAVHTKSLPDLVKIVSLAVDVYETIKRNVYLKKSATLEDALRDVYEPELDVHERKHQTTLLNKIFDHLKFNRKFKSF